MSSKTILVTGATGYVGGRVVPRLLEAGYSVRVLVRDANRLAGRPWSEAVEVVQGDVLKPDSLPPAMDGVWAAYYLIHSMSGHKDFHERDIIAARNFSGAAKDAGVERLIYLGGLGDPNSALSEHLRSRQLTGETLRESGIPLTEFRAGIIVGSGSISFEMVRYLTERLPVMVAPRWVFTETQPIAIRNALAYLIDALEVPDSAGKVIEIGGTDRMRYRDMMMVYADVRGLRRSIMPVPVLTPRLSSYWVHLVTPIPGNIARPLIEGLRNEAVADTRLAHELFPHIDPMPYRRAVELALGRLAASTVETSWSDPLASSQGDVTPVRLTSQEGMLMEHRERLIDAPADEVYRIFTGIGGRRGWLSYNWAWRLRGLLDSLAGGVGYRRGRRHPDELRPGDALDFWRVEALEPNRLMRLRAEMRVPGLAWLQFRAAPLKDDETRTHLTQTAFFAPKGLFGYLYWWALYPIHGPIFSSLIDQVGERAERAYRGQPREVTAPQPEEA
ncbi:MAG: SDR family oxidoreductase [Anaerolineales bacterium]